MIYRSSEFFVLIIAIWIGLMPLIAVAFVTDKVEFTFDYLDKYSQCQAELERTQPTCPDCVCKSSSGWYQYPLGLCVGGLIVYLLSLPNKKKEKKK